MFGEISSVLNLQSQIVHKIATFSRVEEWTMNYRTRTLSVLVRGNKRGAADALGLSTADSLSGVDFSGRVSGINIELSEVSPAQVFHPMT